VLFIHLKIKEGLTKCQSEIPSSSYPTSDIFLVWGRCAGRKIELFLTARFWRGGNFVAPNFQSLGSDLYQIWREDRLIIFRF